MAWKAFARILKILLILLGLVIFGATGFVLTGDPALPPGESWSFLDALFMAVITLTTVGYGEVHRLSTGGRIFAMVYLFIGFGAFSYGLIQLAEIMLQAQFSQWLGRRRMHSTLQHMKNHFIVCGFGRMGQTVCQQLTTKKLPFIAIDRLESAAKECQDLGWPCIVGDATDDRLLVGRAWRGPKAWRQCSRARRTISTWSFRHAYFPRRSRSSPGPPTRRAGQSWCGPGRTTW